MFVTRWVNRSPLILLVDDDVDFNGRMMAAFSNFHDPKRELRVRNKVEEINTPARVKNLRRHLGNYENRWRRIVVCASPSFKYTEEVLSQVSEVATGRSMVFTFGYQGQLGFSNWKWGLGFDCYGHYPKETTNLPGFALGVNHHPGWRWMASSSKDHLTGLPSMAAFEEWALRLIRAVWKESLVPPAQWRYPDAFTMLVMDLDALKKINDEHGHEVGSRCLQVVAQVIAEHIRGSIDICSRYGGDEFVALIVGDGKRVRKNILESLAKVELFSSSRKLIRISMTIGSCTTTRAEITQTAAPKKTLRTLFLRADEDMYAKKPPR